MFRELPLPKRFKDFQFIRNLFVDGNSGLLIGPIWTSAKFDASDRAATSTRRRRPMLRFL